MAYDNNIPQSTDLISNSQSQILQNFQAIKTTVDVNHISFNDSGAGKHKWVTMPNQGAAPATNSTEVAIYTKDVSGNSRLFMRQESNGTEIQLTNRDPSGTTSGETFLPGNFLLKWGQVVQNISGDPVTFPTPFPSVCYSVQVTINNNSPVFTATVNAVSPSKFDLYTTKTGVTHFYIAIGR